MRWRWLRLRQPEQPIEPATWAPPGPIPDGDTIPVPGYELRHGYAGIDPAAERRIAGNRPRRWRMAR